ncbi:MAG: T9SS type A sorting domain-containing protein [Rhodothermales bacterium]
MHCIRYTLFALFLLSGFVTSASFGQISIDRAHAEGQLGQTFTPISVQASSGQSVAIQALAAQIGAGQTWDFTALSFDAPAANPVEQEFIALPDATLLGAGDPRIANATHAVRSIDPAKPNDVSIVYSSFDADGHRTYGTMARVDGATNDLLYDQGLFDYPFPLEFGATWTGSTSYIQSTGGFNTAVSITKDGTANGWGTLQTPQGTVDALRYETELTTTVTVLGFPTATSSRLIFFVSRTGISAGITITSTVQGDVITASYQYDGYGEGGGGNPTDPPATAPAGLSPATAATGVSTSPTLSWGTVDGATAYDLQVAVGGFTKSGSQPIVIEQTGLTTTSFDVTGLEFATEYLWRVRATNEGGAGAWTDAATFTTEAAPLVPPGAVALTSPADLATDVSPVNPSLTWNAAANAATYDVQLATDAAFTLLIVNETGVAGTSVNAPLLAYSTTYHWRVRGVNADGNGDWTTASFTTEAEVVPPTLPGTVTLTAPANATTGVALAPTLTWVAAADAASYEVQVATDAAFTTLTTDQTGVPGTSLALSGLAYNTTYHWRVRGVNTDGAGAWTSASFTTEAEVVIVLPGAVSLVSPADAVLDVETDVTLTWTSAPNALTHDVQVATDASFSGTLIADETGLTGAELALSGLALNTAHFWRVRGVNADGTGEWTAASFTTVTGVATESADGAIPGSFRLAAAYPNPFNPQTTLQFDLPQSSHVTLSVWDLSGREVARLLSGPMAAGSYTHRWNAAHLNSGVYMIRLVADTDITTRTVTLLK